MKYKHISPFWLRAFKVAEVIAAAICIIMLLVACLMGADLILDLGWGNTPDTLMAAMYISLVAGGMWFVSPNVRDTIERIRAQEAGDRDWRP